MSKMHRPCSWKELQVQATMGSTVFRALPLVPQGKVEVGSGYEDVSVCARVWEGYASAWSATQDAPVLGFKSRLCLPHRGVPAWPLNCSLQSAVPQAVPHLTRLRASTNRCLCWPRLSKPEQRVGEECALTTWETVSVSMVLPLCRGQDMLLGHSKARLQQDRYSLNSSLT